MRDIGEILNLADTDRVHSLLTARKPTFRVPFEELQRQYYPDQHKVFDEKYRKKKDVNVPTGKKDPVTGKPLYKTKKVDRVRIAVPCQKVIVERAVGFLFANPADYAVLTLGRNSSVDESQDKLFGAIKKVFHQNKMQFFDKRLARAIFRAREAAELWYMPTDINGKIDTNGKMKVKLLSPLLGDKLYPHFNDLGDMDGFAREYQVKDEEGTAVSHFDVYTKYYVYRYISEGSGWRLNGRPLKHGFSKIPTVYYRQDEAEWEDVQWAIERVEDCISNWGDTNDYFGTPKYFVKGKLNGFAEKGEQGSVFEGEKDTSMNVLSWDNSPASVTGEIAQLFDIIFSYSHSADVSFERMKTIGNNTSGAAIRLMFTDPHMNAETKTELFGEMFTRRCNIVANGIVETGIVEPNISERVAQSVEFKPIFKPYMPKNEVEQLQLISTATGGKQTTSMRRAIAINPLNDDPVRVEKELEEEEQRSLDMAAQAMAIGESSNSVEE